MHVFATTRPVAPRHRIGLASGILNASRQTGGPFGIAVLGALLVAGRGRVSLHVAFVATAGCYAAAIALAVAGHRHTRATTETRSRP